MQQYRTRGFIRGLVAIGLLIGVVSLTDLAQAANSKGQYYATPSWNQKLPADTRFVVLADWNNEAVLDRNTGLVWEKSPSAFGQSWFDARRACIQKNVGGQMGWRMPAVAEIASLIDRSVTPGPTLPSGHPFTGVLVSSFFYWSATTDAETPTYAWNVDFNYGTVRSGSKGYNGGASLVWCVRGGMNADAY